MICPSNLASDTATTVFATSDGDMLAEPTDWWVATDDADGSGSPAIVHVLGGPRGLRPTSLQLTGDNLVWSFDLTVEAGQTSRLGAFTIPGTTRAQALAPLNGLIELTGFAGSAGQFLTEAELASLANMQFFHAPTASGPLPDVTVDEDAAPTTIDLRTAFDDLEDGPAGLVYTVRALTGTPGLVTGTINPATDALTLRYGQNVHGSGYVTMRATDPEGLFLDRTFQVEVTSVIDGPFVDVSHALLTPNIPKNAASPAGVPITSLLRNAYHPDGPSGVLGIAVTGVGGVAGQWEYATSAGGLWKPISGASNATALLLARTTLVRFVPDLNKTGHAGLEFRVWDGVTGTAESVVNTSSAPLVFSTDSEVAWVPVGIKSPKYDGLGRIGLRAGKEDAAGPATIARSLLGFLATEFPATTKLGLAITGVTGNGVWQVKVGRIWQPISAVSDYAARLLKPTDRMRFVPAGDWFGEATVTYRAWKVPASNPLPTIGDVSADPASYSAERLTSAAQVTPVNDAPTIDLSIPRVFDSSPQSVATLLQGAADIDGSVTGIAVTRATSKNGTWEYRPSAADPWTKIAGVSIGRALLLDPAAEIRFVPAAGATLSTGNLDYKACDNSVAFVSGDLDRATSTAFSRLTETASFSLGNTAPTFRAGANPVFPKTTLTKKPASHSVATLLSRMTDTPSFLKGIAVTGTSGNGTWDFSLDGGRTWQAVGSLGSTRLLLRSTDRLRFTPVPSAPGTATLSFAAWDRTTGAAGDRLPGTNDSQSSEILTAVLVVA